MCVLRQLTWCDASSCLGNRYFTESEEHYYGIVAQNTVQRWNMMEGREMCERVPPGVDPSALMRALCAWVDGSSTFFTPVHDTDHPDLLDMIAKMQECLQELKQNEAEDRLRGDIKLLVEEMTDASKAKTKAEEALATSEANVDRTSEEVRKRYAELSATKDANEIEAAAIRKRHKEFKYQHDRCKKQQRALVSRVLCCMHGACNKQWCGTHCF